MLLLISLVAGCTSRVVTFGIQRAIFGTPFIALRTITIPLSADCGVVTISTSSVFRAMIAMSLLRTRTMGATILVVVFNFALSFLSITSIIIVAVLLRLCRLSCRRFFYRFPRPFQCSPMLRAEVLVRLASVEEDSTSNIDPRIVVERHGK